MACHETALWLAEHIEALGLFDMICTGDPAKSISAVTWPFKDGVQLPFTLFALADRLRTRGWLVPAYTLPANLTTIAVQRIYVRQGLSRDRASLLIKDIRHALEHFECHSVQVPLTKEESGGYNHT
jgi:glutamate decarboxylase